MTKKTLLLILLFLGYTVILSAQQISTSGSASLETLIQSTLGQGCVKISNISSSVNGSVNDLPSYGQFSKADSNFPFKNGLVITTGNVLSGGNVLDTKPLSEGTSSWGTDPDLETALGISKTLNATSIEFDFISAGNSISFNYLLASEEYLGINPCSFSDGFAFLIKKAGSPDPYENIALIPGTTSPVNTSNIHPKIAGFCPAKNEEYFQGYNLGDTNYNGRTKVLTASTQILPNEKYHIKLIIADQGDPNLDSAVFIEGNSFNANIDLGTSLKTCASSVTLNADTGNPSAVYKWFRNDITITGATNPSYLATQPGMYKVIVSIPLDGQFCEVEDSVKVELEVLETLPNISDYTLCDSTAGNGKATFDLNSRNAEILQSLPDSNYEISYHFNEADAQSKSNPITSPIQNTENPQNIYIRIEDKDNDCASLSGVKLIVSPWLPIKKPADVKICDTDDNLDGFTEIDLTAYNAEIMSLNADTTNLYLTYHRSAADAQSGANPLLSPFTNTSAEETIYIRLFSENDACFSTTSFKINVSAPPKLDIARPYLNACLKNSENFANFNISAEVTKLIAGLNVTASIYETKANAENKINPITNGGNYQSITPELQIIYLRLEDNVTGCINIIPFELHIDIAKTGFNTEIFNGCDNAQNGIVNFDLHAVETQILQNYEGFDVVFFSSPQAQQDNTPQLNKDVPFQVSVSPTEIYATIKGEGCEDFIPISLVINPPVILPTFPVVEYCGRHQDGKATIPLVDLDPYVIGNIEKAEVKYYRTEQEAIDDENWLVTNFYNKYREQTIYVRVTDPQTTCYDIAPLHVKVLDAPILKDSFTMTDCNADENGFGEFNLLNSINELVADSTDLTFSFYRNYNLAVAGESEIENPELFKGRSQYIAVRIVDNNGCFSIGALYLIANTPPIITPISNFQNCTLDSSKVADFYFHEKDEEILNGQVGKQVLYFENEQDAIDRTNEIDKFSPFKNDPTISQVIYVRLEAENDPNCFATSSFILEVDKLPSYNPATDVFVCDESDNDGFTSYDLNIKAQEIIKDIPDALAVSFYISEEDADQQVNKLNSNYTNTANPQTIIARIDNASYCYSLTSFSLNVVPLPNVEVPTDLYFCDSNASGTGLFDLRVVKLLDVRPENILVSYHESSEGANSNTDIITNPQAYSSSMASKTIYARINNTLGGCILVEPITLHITAPPLVENFIEFPTCENPEKSFDLSLVNDVITLEENVIISYFSSSQDANNNNLAAALDLNYTYITNNDQIFVRIESSISGCVSFYDFRLKVNPLPIANKPQNPEFCDDDFDGVLIFDFTNQTTEIRGNQNSSDYDVTYYTSWENADSDDQPLGDSYSARHEQVIFARVTNNKTGCYSITDFQTLIQPKPIIPVTDQAICLDNLPLVVSAETTNTGDIYLWSTGATSTEIEIHELGSYWVSVTNSFGCESTKEFNVVESEAAVIESTEIIDFSDPHNITITVRGTGNYRYILDDGPPQESNVFENVSLGFHTITIRDLNGCADVTKEVVVIDAPKFFTPNNDGYFDTWHVSGIETMPGSILYIYDRYGKLLKTLTSDSAGWDGTYNNKLLPSSDYWYFGKIIKEGNSFEVKGHFSLKR